MYISVIRISEDMLLYQLKESIPTRKHTLPFLKMSVVYSEPTQTSKMEPFCGYS